MIETKKGRRSSTPRVTFTSQFGVADQAVKMHETVGAEDYMKYTWEALKNANGGSGQYATDNLIARLRYNPYGSSFAKPIDANGNVVSGAKLLWDTDWKDLILNKSAIRQEYGVNVDGGNENTTYNFGASYLNQEGSIITSKFERTTIKANVVSKVDNWLELGLNSLASFGYENGPTQSGSSYQSPIQWINSVSNIYPLYKRDASGNFLFDALGQKYYDYGEGVDLVNGARPVLATENAVGALLNGYKATNKRLNLNVNGYAKINFTDFLSFKTTMSYQKYFYDYSGWSSNLYGNAASVDGRITKNRDTQDTKNLFNSLNFNKSFGDHNLSVDAIMDMYDFSYETMSAQGVGFLPGISVLNGTTKPESVGGAIYRERILGYMGRVSYDYASKYFLEGSFRKEASTRFAEDVRWGDFFSVGASWIISKENFLRGSDVVSNLKLRGSYGETGNNRTSSYFPYSQDYAAGWSNLNETGLNATALVDDLITWEKQATTNIGLDFGFFKNRITGSVEYYNRASKDLIMGTALAPSGGMGFTSITTNIGSMKNYGIEVNLNTVNVRNDNFEWTTGINVGTVKNEITKLNGAEFIIDGTKRLEVGGDLYEFYIWEYAGVDPTDGAAMWYKDDADGNKVTTKDYSSATRYKQGKSSLPDFEGGFTNYFRYKNFDLNVLFNFSVGAYIYDSTYAGLMNTGASAGYQWSTDIYDRWQNLGDITNTPKLTTSQNNYNSTSTRFLYKNDYLRLKALNVGYNFSQRNLQQMGIKGLRIYFQGDNLLTFQSHKGIDPEQSITGTTNSRSYQQRIYTVGFNVKL
ncbi:SusC/RagA family TonB-linked outer membrane protein [Empedobacter sp. UBA5987]|uniref:SusC/RagA family TonB-linked outer membrane protein n=1 Tax=Empedobacter sp. UBA5987 TaxID=1946444 RepID=UPI0025B802DA|nr:SusC/RagA family TonB-linked outer membrane protein [Empedobacter sp. UBA5987]